MAPLRSSAPIRREDVLRLLAEHREELRRDHRVRSLSLFGSVARDRAGPESDVDVLVEFNYPVSLLTMGGLQQYLAGLFDREVDLVSRDAIKPRLRERIFGEEMPVLAPAPDGSLMVVATDGLPGLASDHPGRGDAMAERDWRVRIEDIPQAIDDIARFTEGMTIDTFVADRRTVLAVNFSFAVIGEAARQIPSEVEARYPAIPWARMRGMRNVLIHDYHNTDMTVVWETARDDLPPLVPLLREILEQEP
jgi:uncharacterized protein with HEPN domain/predicted nucleotidyltransferase